MKKLFAAILLATIALCSITACNSGTAPSVTPTVVPSVAPTANPSVEETVEPSAEPTIEPTVEPTIEPTVEPTVTPSVECEHNFMPKEVLQQGDCVTPSLVLFECEYCQDTEERPVVNSGAQYHTVAFTPAKQSTCKEQGNLAYYYCSVCEKYFSSEALTEETTLQDITLAYAEHTTVYHAAKESTCKEQGNLAYYYCSVCEKYFSNEALTEETTLQEVTLAYAAHTTVYYAAMASTCEKQGNLEHYYCSVCDRYYADETCTEEMPKSDVILRLSEEHPYPQTYTYTPTGHWIESTCSHKVRKPNSFSAHHMGSWIESKPATYEEEGEEKSSCICGYFETRKTDKLTQPPVIPSPDLPDEPTEQTILNIPFAREETFVFGGWQRRTVQELQGSVSATADGTGSLHMYLTEEGKAAHNSFTQWLNTSFNVTEGKKYVVSFAYRVKDPGVGSGAQLIDGISTVNSMEDPNTFLYQFGIQWHTLQAEVWHRASVEFTATETATYYLVFKMYGLYKYSEYWFDELKIVEYAVDEPYYKVENGNPVTISFLYPDQTMDSTACLAGDVIDFPQPKRIAGQVFAGWYTSKEYARRVYTPATDGNRRYFAKYLPAVTLTFHQNNGKGDIVREVAYNSSLGELIFPEREGYAFAGWFTSDNKPFSAYRNCTKHGEYYARWVEEEQAAEFMDNFGF
ncbi:MAG: InlB B-repeat-containing protein, partial [Clostridia bacterium]|nr:InlB B-repeat-containing protein [Clostridia bacterium]